jgi:hypothetical protein
MALQFKGSSSLVLPDIVISGDFTINLPTIHYTPSPTGDPQVIISTVASNSVVVGIYDGGNAYINAGGSSATIPTGFQDGDLIEGVKVQRVGDTITITYNNGTETLSNSVTANLGFTLLRIGNDKNNGRPLHSTVSGVLEIIRSNDTNVTYDFDTEVTPNVLTDTTSGLDGTYGDSVAEFVELGVVIKQITFDLPSQMQGVSGLYYLVTSVPLGASILNGENLDTSESTLNMSLTSVEGIAVGMPLMLVATDKLEATDASDIIGWSVATVTGE